MNDEMISQTSGQAPDVEESPPPEKNRSESGRGGVLLGLFVAVLALGLAGWQWLETHNRLSEARQEIASRLSASDAAAGEGRALAKQAQERMETLQDRLGALEARLAESISQQDALQNLYRNLARGNGESILAEIEQNVTLASQYLQLAGNIHGAIAALEVAEARLADDGRPQFIGLRKVLARDLERLRALPQPDFAELYLHLENVIEAVDTLTLASDERPGEPVTPPVALPDAAPWELSSLLSREYWQALGLNLWGKIRALVRIQRTDRAALPVLLPPHQEFFLRENLRLRLLNARLALLARDQWVFRKELDQARAWIERHFDGNGKNARNSLQTLRQLMDREIRVDLPNLNESLSAIKRFRAEKEH
jgi:uroporphyrin-3 C-methyltransferase